jgi:N-acetylmuramoyl-L-alanine amidase
MLAEDIRRLASAGTIRLTRTSDIDLSWHERVSLANQRRHEPLLTLHTEHSPQAQTAGIRLYLYVPPFGAVDSREDLPTAESVVFKHLVSSDQFANTLASSLRDEFSDVQVELKRGEFLPLYGVDGPAVMVTIGFMSNASDCLRMQDAASRARLARALIKGVVAYAALERNP